MPSPHSDKLLTYHQLCERTGLVSYVCLARFPTWSFQAGRARVLSPREHSCPCAACPSRRRQGLQGARLCPTAHSRARVSKCRASLWGQSRRRQTVTALQRNERPPTRAVKTGAGLAIKGVPGRQVSTPLLIRRTERLWKPATETAPSTESKVRK